LSYAQKQFKPENYNGEIMRNSELIDEEHEKTLIRNKTLINQENLVVATSFIQCFEEVSQEIFETESSHFVLGYN
jgi:hypothetical protein